MTAPQTLQTERLRLRWLAPGDEDLLLAVWNDPAFIENVGDRGIRTIEQAGEALANGPLKLYAEHGYGPYRVALADSDEPIGLCGLFKREFLVDPDIGFGLLPNYRGKGFAYEAATVVLDHARHGLGLSRLTAIVSPRNTTSIGMIEKLGLRFESMVTIPEKDMLTISGKDKELCLYSVEWDSEF